MDTEDAGIIPAGMLFFQQFWSARDLGTRDFHRILRHGNRKPREIRRFHGNCLDGNGKSRSLRELFGREREIKISSGTVWTGPRERYLHGNGKKKTFPVQSRGNFPEQGPGNNHGFKEGTVGCRPPSVQEKTHKMKSARMKIRKYEKHTFIFILYL